MNCLAQWFRIDLQNQPITEEFDMVTDTKNVQMTLSMSPALEAKLARLAVASGSSEADVLLKAIALYEVALLAKLQGQDLAVLNEEKCVVSEIDGI